MPTCLPDRAEACPERHTAVRDGRCWYSWEAKGWFIVRNGVPTGYTRCPWCGGKLPTLVDAVLRAIAEREDDGR